MSACVFLGPTLPAADAASVLDAICLPPVKLGRRLPRRVAPRPRAIGIVDGYFQWVPAVWHKEILWAIDQGVHVFGAASMGALRAAELAPFGMRGVGRIFEAYRDGGSTAWTTSPSRTTTRWRSSTARRRAAISAPPRRWSTSAARWPRRCRARASSARRRAASLAASAKAAFFPDRATRPCSRRGARTGCPRPSSRRWSAGCPPDASTRSASTRWRCWRRCATSSPPTRRRPGPTSPSSAPPTGSAPRPRFERPASRRRPRCWRRCGSTPPDASASARTSCATGTSRASPATARARGPRPVDARGRLRRPERLPSRRLRRIPRAGGRGRGRAPDRQARSMNRRRLAAAPTTAAALAERGTRFRLYPQAPICAAPEAARDRLGLAARRVGAARARPTTACTWPTRSEGSALRAAGPAALPRRPQSAGAARPRRPLRPPRARHPRLHGGAHVRHDPLRARRLGALSRRRDPWHFADDLDAARARPGGRLGQRPVRLRLHRDRLRPARRRRSAPLLPRLRRARARARARLHLLAPRHCRRRTGSAPSTSPSTNPPPTARR